MKAPHDAKSVFAFKFRQQCPFAKKQSTHRSQTPLLPQIESLLHANFARLIANDPWLCEVGTRITPYC
jgi:hypothetical protein